jgi:hypothetical protein
VSADKTVVATGRVLISDMKGIATGTVMLEIIPE